jgi:hypothetical protein
VGASARDDRRSANDHFPQFVSIDRWRGRQNRREKKPESDQARLYWLPEVLATPASPRIAFLFSKQ